MSEIVKVDPKSIVLDANTRFVGVGELPITDLIASIRAHGQTQPINLYVGKDGKYHLIGGHRRTMACTELGIDVDAIIRPAPTSEQEAVMLRYSDNKHLHCSAMDRAVTMKQMMDAGMKQPQIAAEFGVKRPYVSMLLNLLKLCLPAQMLLHAGKVGIAWAIAVGRMERAEQLAECEKVEKGSSDIDDRERYPIGDDGTIQSPSAAEEGKEISEASAPRKAPTGTPGQTQAKTLKQVRETLVAAIGSKHTGDDYADCCRVILAYCQDIDIQTEEVVSALESKTKIARFVKNANQAANAREIIRHEQEQQANERKEAKKAKDKAEAAERDKAAIARLLAAGWTHTKGNPNQWTHPKRESAVRLTTVQALMELGNGTSA